MPIFVKLMVSFQCSARGKPDATITALTCLLFLLSPLPGRERARVRVVEAVVTFDFTMPYELNWILSY